MTAVTRGSDIHSLGYIEIQTTDKEGWRKLLSDGLGLAPGSGSNPDADYYRVDERRSRIAIVPGEVDKVLAVGWEVRDEVALEGVAEAVTKAGREVTRWSWQDAAERGAEGVISFVDPTGLNIEVFFSPVLDHSPLVTPFAGTFVAGTEGLGHVVLPTPNFQETYEFYTQVLGFLNRGSMRMGPKEMPLRVRFLGVNRRHHSLAIAPAPHGDPPGLVHLMIEVDTLDAVGQALDRINKLGFSLSSTLGRHTNDKMVSFYVRAPGGVDIEFGTEGMLVDERYYSTEEITADSYWGHDWSGSEPLAAFQPAQGK